MKQLLLSIFLLFLNKLTAMVDPPHIKSVAFTQNTESLIPVFQLNSSFTFSFDDLYGVPTDYYYKIVHCDKDWKVSNIRVTEYLNGMNDFRISNYETSFNTLQSFVHYKLTLPNRDTKVLLSGNYILEIYNDQNEKILERKFVLFEDMVSVDMEIKKTRNLEVTDAKQNVYLSVNFGEMNLINPKKNISLVVLQNGQFYSALKNIQPQYILGNEFKYQYDKETNFWGGNEYLHFDNSNIRNVNNYVEKAYLGDLYQTYVRARATSSNNFYTYYFDVNGAFKPRNQMRDNANTEADYAWVYFDYKLDKLPSGQKIFVVGMFNDYQLSNQYEMIFDDETLTYKGAILLKQGYTDYKYVITKNDGTILDELNPEGNFFETNNVYHALIYYKSEADRYDRVIGLGKAESNLITN